MKARHLLVLSPFSVISSLIYSILFHRVLLRLVLMDGEQKSATCFRHTCKTLIDTPVCVCVCAYVYMSYYEKNDGLEESEARRFFLLRSFARSFATQTCSGQSNDNVNDMFLLLLCRSRFDSCCY